ncbi:MAG: NAD-dependent epimerase/dehydratase family protein, partial [Planctomycetota bacterium]
MRVMVTGNLGYIGTILTPMIQVAGHSVVGVDVDFYRNCTFGNAFTKMHTIYKDIRDIERADLNGIDAICHLAAPLANLNPELTFEINYKASVRLAELAKQASVKRFIFSSSCSNYGSAGDKMLNEESAFNPVTPYGKSKVLV